MSFIKLTVALAFYQNIFIIDNFLYYKMSVFEKLKSILTGLVKDPVYLFTKKELAKGKESPDIFWQIKKNYPKKDTALIKSVMQEAIEDYFEEKRNVLRWAKIDFKDKNRLREEFISREGRCLVDLAKI